MYPKKGSCGYAMHVFVDEQVPRKCYCGDEGQQSTLCAESQMQAERTSPLRYSKARPQFGMRFTHSPGPTAKPAGIVFQGIHTQQGHYRR